MTAPPIFPERKRRSPIAAIECKSDRGVFDSSALRQFRGYYPQGRNYLVTPSGDPAYVRRYGELEVTVCTPAELRGYFGAT